MSRFFNVSVATSVAQQTKQVRAPSSDIRALCTEIHACVYVAACQAHAAIHFWWCSVSQLTLVSLFWQAVVWCDKLHWPPFSIHQHRHDKFTTAHVDPLLLNQAFQYHSPEPQRIMTSQEIIRSGLTDRPCDFLPPKSTRQWPRHPTLILGLRPLSFETAEQVAPGVVEEWDLNI